jgi:hypothetical protein
MEEIPLMMMMIPLVDGGLIIRVPKGSYLLNMLKVTVYLPCSTRRLAYVQVGRALLKAEAA